QVAGILEGLDGVSFEVIETAVSNASPYDSPFREAVEAATRDAIGVDDIAFVPGISVGFTDSRFVRPLGNVTYGFVPSAPTDDPSRSGAHNINESIGIDSVIAATKLHAALAYRLLTRTSSVECAAGIPAGLYRPTSRSCGTRTIARMVYVDGEERRPRGRVRPTARPAPATLLAAGGLGRLHRLAVVTDSDTGPAEEEQRQSERDDDASVDSQVDHRLPELLGIKPLHTHSRAHRQDAACGADCRDEQKGQEGERLIAQVGQNRRQHLHDDEYQEEVVDQRDHGHRKLL